MIQQVNAHNLPGFFQLPCYDFVCGGGFEISCWVVVRHDDPGSPVGQRIGKDLPGMNRAAVHQADGNDPDTPSIIPLFLPSFKGNAFSLQ
jgi:hypothetical protein